jgi:tetratricopeptide (TPR) repeat protein
MEPQEKNPFGKQNINDGMAAIFALGSVVAAATTQSVTVAVLPLVGAMGVQMFNRRQLLMNITNHYETMIRQQNLHIVNHQSSIKNVSEQLDKLQNEVGSNLDIYSQESQKTFASHANTIASLQSSFAEIQASQQDLSNQQQNLSTVVEKLQQIENASHALQSDPTSSEMYYQRGLNFQELGDKEAAISDFNQVIQLDSRHAQAYHQRGLMKAELRDMQSAVDDLRSAAKFYFENGEIDQYHQARELAKELYEGDLKKASDSEESSENNDLIFSEQVLVGSLFDSN